MAQRLLRRICPHCCEAYEPKRSDVPSDFPWDQLQGPLHRSVGCRECRQVGFRGRLGIYELLLTTDNIRELAQVKESSWKIKQAGARDGMKTLRDDGWQKALSGTTSIDEVTRVTKMDRGLE